jgi:hypothetical protein
VQVVRVHDPDRQPTNWSGLIRPGQFVAFAKLLDGGGSCDAEGQPFRAAADTSCLFFDSLDAAEAFCTERARRNPAVRFEIFDAQGRANPPLLVVVDPSRAATLSGNPRTIRRYQVAAAALIAGAAGLFWWDWTQERDFLVLPTILGANMLLAAGRLLQMSFARRDAERARRERLSRAAGKDS